MDQVLVWVLIDPDFNKCFKVSFSIPKNPFHPTLRSLNLSKFNHSSSSLSQPSITLWNKFKFSLLPILSQFKERHVGQVMILIDPTKLQLDKAMGSVSANESAVWITNNYQSEAQILTPLTIDDYSDCDYFPSCSSHFHSLYSHFSLLCEDSCS